MSIECATRSDFWVPRHAGYMRAGLLFALSCLGVPLLLTSCVGSGPVAESAVHGRDGNGTQAVQVKHDSLEWVPLTRTNDVVGQMNDLFIYKMNRTLTKADHVKQLTAINVRGDDDQLLVLDMEGVVHALRDTDGQHGENGKLVGTRVMDGAQQVIAARTSQDFCVHGQDGRLHFYCSVDAGAPFELTATSDEVVSSIACFDWNGQELVTWDGEHVLTWSALQARVTNRLRIGGTERSDSWEPVALDAAARRVASIRREPGEVCLIDYSGVELRRQVSDSPMDLRAVNFKAGNILVVGDKEPRARGAGPSGFDYWRPLHEPSPARLSLANPMLKFLVVEDAVSRPYPNSFGYDFVHARSSPLGYRLLGVQEGGHVWFVDLENARPPFRCQLVSASRQWRCSVIGAFSPSKPVFYVLTGQGDVYRFEYGAVLIGYQH